MDMDRRGETRRWLARWWFPLAAIAVAAALAAAVVAEPRPLPGEVGYVHWLQDLGEPVPTIADLVRATTGTEGALAVAALPAVWLVWRGRRRGALVVAVAAVTMLAVQPAVKEIVDRPRPSAEVVEVRAEHESQSYPSGHSMSTTTVWGTVVGAAWTLRRRAAAVAASVPLVATFFSSAVQGVHWPTDAVGGTLLGAAAAWLMVPDVVAIVDLRAGGPAGHARHCW